MPRVKPPVKEMQRALSGRGFNIKSLKAVRQSAGLSQRDLAKRTGYSPGFINDIENHRSQDRHFNTVEIYLNACGYKLVLFRVR